MARRVREKGEVFYGFYDGCEELRISNGGGVWEANNVFVGKSVSGVWYAKQGERDIACGKTKKELAEAYAEYLRRHDRPDAFYKS